MTSDTDATPTGRRWTDQLAADFRDLCAFEAWDDEQRKQIMKEIEAFHNQPPPRWWQTWQCDCCIVLAVATFVVVVVGLWVLP